MKRRSFKLSLWTLMLVAVSAMVIKLNGQQVVPLFERQLASSDKVAVSESLINQGVIGGLDEYGRILVPRYLRASLRAQLVLEGLPAELPADRRLDLPRITKEELQHSEKELVALLRALPQIESCQVELSEPKSYCLCDYRPVIARVSLCFIPGSSLSKKNQEALVRVVACLAPLRSHTDVSLLDRQGRQLNPEFVERVSPHASAL